MTDPFARWADQYRDRPGQLPTREVLAALDAATVVGVRADILLQLVVQAENHEERAHGICGEQAPSLTDAPLVGREVCTLRAGHDGWHEGANWLADGHVAPPVRWGGMATHGLPENHEAWAAE